MYILKEWSVWVESVPENDAIWRIIHVYTRRLDFLGSLATILATFLGTCGQKWDQKVKIGPDKWHEVIQWQK